LISADTALANSARFGQPLEHELGLYVIHGLLHLNGHDDLDPRAARKMRQVQTVVLQTVLSQSAP